MKYSKSDFILLSLILRLESRVSWILYLTSLALNHISAALLFIFRVSDLLVWPWTPSWPRLTLDLFSSPVRSWSWDPMASTSQVAGITDLCHCVRLANLLLLWPYRLTQFESSNAPPEKSCIVSQITEELKIHIFTAVWLYSNTI